MRLEVEKENEKFIQLINKVLTTFTKKERNDILDNYQLVSYQQDFDFLYVIKIVIPLIILLIVLLFFNYRLKNEIKRRKKTEKELSKFANKDSLTNMGTSKN